jgi:GDPmannose 4,6-dehydratase
MKAIIFGINGQDGFYLSKLLDQNNIEVIGVDIRGENVTVGDISDYAFTENLIKEHKPDYVFHLAALSSTKHEAMFANHKAISTGTLNILESVRVNNPQCKIFLSGTALQFKNSGEPIDENTPFEGKSAYAVSRIDSVYSARYFRETFGLKVYVGYFFNHDSPRRPEQHVSQLIVSKIKQIEKGEIEKLEIGDIDVQKEFNYAEDIVEAIWVLVSQEKIFEAVIGSGEAHSLKEWVEYCFKKIGKNWEDYVTKKEGFVSEYRILVSDPTLIKSLGWKPKVGFFELADMMMQ